MKLYRYRSINSKDLIRTFTHCEFYFASPTQFNDPFDCRPPFSTTDFSEDDLKYYFRKAYHKECPELNNSKLEMIIEEKVTSVIKNNTFESIAQNLYNACLEENSKLGVLCFSRVRNDILMWSHYADGHKGLVLQFDKKKLIHKKAFKYCEKVDYDNNILTLHDINNATPNEMARSILLNKDNRWKYEKEWRIITDPDRRTDIPGCRIFRYPKEALSGVIFGCEMHPDVKYMVKNLLKEGNHKVKLYEAKRDISSYSVSITPLLT